MRLLSERNTRAVLRGINYSFAYDVAPRRHHRQRAASFGARWVTVHGEK